jgi:hypothetical protein
MAGSHKNHDSRSLIDRRPLYDGDSSGLPKSPLLNQYTLYNHPLKIYFHLFIAGNFNCLLLRAF